ncbi:MAG: hypothetical protein IPJ30_11225 [Acidobacteria bacterium]|nr:hypothetical protein [Acidobacteriota bacterium]
MAGGMRRFAGTVEKSPYEFLSERSDRTAKLLGSGPDLLRYLNEHKTLECNTLRDRESDSFREC